MPLPHWDNSVASRNSYEPIFQNQFEFIINPPAGLAGDANAPLLVEHILKVSGLPEQLTSGNVTQYYKFAKRLYSAAVPNETTVKLSTTFEVNLDNENNMYVYNTLRAWGDLIYDPLTGRQGLKRDYVGSAKLVIFNKAGDIYREYTFVNMFLETPISAMTLDYTATGIYQITASFVADTYRETRIGQIAV
jgi:hypothetical protein